MEVVRWKENHEKRTELGINPYAACLLPFPIVSQPIEQYPNLRSSLSQRMSINVTTACSCMSFMNGLFSNPISLGKGIFFQFEQRYPYLANYPRFRSPQFCPLLQYSGQQTASFIGNLASDISIHPHWAPLGSAFQPPNIRISGVHFRWSLKFLGVGPLLWFLFCTLFLTKTIKHKNYKGLTTCTGS